MDNKITGSQYPFVNSNGKHSCYYNRHGLVAPWKTSWVCILENLTQWSHRYLYCSFFYMLVKNNSTVTLLITYCMLDTEIMSIISLTLHDRVAKLEIQIRQSRWHKACQPQPVQLYWCFLIFETPIGLPLYWQETWDYTGFIIAWYHTDLPSWHGDISLEPNACKAMSLNLYSIQLPNFSFVYFLLMPDSTTDTKEQHMA